MRLHPAVLLPALFLSGCQSSQRGPVKPGYDSYGVLGFNGQAGLRVEARDESRSGRNGRLEHSELRSREEIGLSLLAFYYHPKLVEFDLNTSFGLEQRKIKSTGALESNAVDGQNVTYDLRVRLFKDLDYSAEVYALRTETKTRQSFFQTSEAVVNELGMNVFAREWFIPSVLNINHHTYEGRGLNDYSETRDTVRLEGRRDDESAHYQYITEFNDVKLGLGSNPYRDVNLSGSATHYFGQDNAHRLYNGAFIRRQTGNITNSNMNLNNSYRHQWLESLFTSHEFQFSTFERDQSTTNTNNLSSSISHQLFQSLTSTAGGRFSRSSFGAGNLSAYGWNASVGYNKRTPIGRFSLQQTMDTYVQDRGPLQGTALVLDEIHVNNAGDPLFLSSIAIDSASVVVTDQTGLIIYLAGIDYFVIPVGSRTRLEIPVGSKINPGQTVLVDYSFQPTPEQEVRTETVGTTVSLGVFEHADFLVGRSQVRQDLLDGFDDGTLEESMRFFASARFYPTDNIVFGGEYEDFESNLTPFSRTRVFFDYNRNFDQNYVWQTTANLYKSSFDGDSRDEYGGSLSSSLVAYVNFNTQADVRLEAHRNRFRTDDGTGFMFEAGYRKFFRSTTMSLQLRYLSEQFDVADDQDLFSLEFVMSRRF